MFDIVKQEGEKAFVMTAGASQLCKLIIGLAKEEGFGRSSPCAATSRSRC